MNVETTYVEDTAWQTVERKVVKLFDRNDGSYFYPSPSSTADRCIEFWSNIAIPDEIITQAENAYYNDRVAEIEEDITVCLEDWAHRWVESNPSPKKNRDVEAYNEQFRQDREAYRLSVLPHFQAQRPLEMGSYDARQLIRAYQMITGRPSSVKFPEESDKVLNHPIELFDETLTVWEVENKYHLDRIKGFLSRVRGDGSQEAVLSAIAETNSLLGEISKNLVYTRIEARDRAEY